MTQVRKVIQRETRAFYQYLYSAGPGNPLMFTRNLNISFQPDEFIVKQIQYIKNTNPPIAETGTVGFILNTDLTLQSGFNQIAFFSQTGQSSMLNTTFTCTKSNLNFSRFWVSSLPSSDTSLNTQQQIVSLSTPAILPTDPSGDLFVMLEFIKYAD